ncbi:MULTISPECIES: bifunctional phosphoribosyl-AMP cyclohydrolase/phosphoribosyl-ATP diphosphatase HisIE [unclassified Pseudoalteromonas]|uniref:bifunctional phosphoribosyl-AMP cyclohydrolase/phosphoribosyl-ATP diphosphatase HisIE n=1 Tax=unclassified Pseudoalteromonas TaxID=194690 RepID=UPI0005A98355|nr:MULTISPECIES: bifunctional phosphoribosyl-AMP cyclohydrolase/phosphoribosyl-ATP diphosphatase HisIE [unclassified Pseudoalteromonas]
MLINTNNIKEIDFSKSELIPAIVQDKNTGIILMQGFMNYEAMEKTLDCNMVTFYSRSKQRLWTKGESSDNYLIVKEVHTDCDFDSILILAEPKGPTCHLGTQSCFGNAKPELAFVAQLNQIISQRKNDDPKESYTASLFAKDISRSAQKVGEEGVEVALAAVKQDIDELKNESADLLYHLLVLLQRSETDISQVVKVLEQRHK